MNHSSSGVQLCLCGDAAGVWAWLLASDWPTLASISPDALAAALSRVHLAVCQACTTKVPPFVLLARVHRLAALRALPLLERALLFENFAMPNSVEAWQTTDDELDSSFTMSSASRKLSNRGGVHDMAGTAHLKPLSAWCAFLEVSGPPSDFSLPPRLERRLDPPIRPARVACHIRCRCPHVRFRCGGILSLCGQSHLDTGESDSVLLVFFSHDSSGRRVFASGGCLEVALGSWEDDRWYQLIAYLDWQRKYSRIQVLRDGEENPEGGQAQFDVPFPNQRTENCMRLSMTTLARDFEACWTDLLIT